MLMVALFAVLAGWTLIGPLSMAIAQSSVLRQQDGTTGMLSPLGAHDAIYSDAYGNKIITQQGSGLPSHTFSSPHGAMPGTVTPFGTPTPPNLITPAPLLPLQPRGMATPQPQTPTSSRPPGGIGSFNGRSGH